jgi:hypothetical protein
MGEVEKSMQAGAKLERERLARTAMGLRVRNEDESRNAREFAAAGEVAERQRILRLFEEHVKSDDHAEWAEWAIDVINLSKDYRYL